MRVGEPFLGKSLRGGGCLGTAEQSFPLVGRLSQEGPFMASAIRARSPSPTG